MISMKKEYVLKSRFADKFTEYLYERSLSISESTLQHERYYIEGLDRYLAAYPDNEQELTNARLDKWLEHRPGEKKGTQKKRLDFTKRLCTHLRKTDSKVEIPLLILRNTQPDYIPYIFTHDEIQKIFQASDCYKPTIRSPYLHLTVPITFRILYGCGIRSGELVSLKIGDVNTEDNLLYIRESKFGKSRYVPFSASLSVQIQSYLSARFQELDKDRFFIASRNDNIPYTTSAVHSWLVNLLFSAGISHGGKGFGPRVHDFRHTFAVHSMQKAFQNKKDLLNFLPVLSAYLGHKDLRGTQYYLKLTAEIYPDILEALAEKYGKILGGDGYEE